MSNLWYDITEWKWWPRIAAVWMAGVVGLAVASGTGIIDYKGRPGTAEEKCWSYGGRSDNTWNC